MFFKTFAGILEKVGKKLETNMMKNPGRALEIGARIGNAAVGENPTAASGTIPDVMFFHQTGNSLYLGNFFDF